MRPRVRRDRGGQLFHRWYQPGTGRYSRPDPIKSLGGMNNWLYEPNVYVYVSNNPTQLIDPLGLYGTNDCSYYTKRCEECGGGYYCKLAPRACDLFLKYPDPDPAADNDFECTPDACSGPEPDPATDEFGDESHTDCHVKCYSFCHFWATWGEGDPGMQPEFK